MYFRKNARGNYVGYHHQGGENFSESGGIHLSMDTLDNERPLFMANEANTEWNGWEVEPDGTLYEIEFGSDVKIWHTDNLKAYWDLTLFTYRSEFKQHRYSPMLEKLMAEGYRVFLCIPQNESSEGFLVYPKQHVIGMQVYLQSDQAYREVNT